MIQDGSHWQAESPSSYLGQGGRCLFSFLGEPVCLGEGHSKITDLLCFVAMNFGGGGQHNTELPPSCDRQDLFCHLRNVLFVAWWR